MASPISKTGANPETASVARPPIIVVVGHVDHGKTTLLDYIRKTRVAEREAGGITQSVGAYEIMHRSRTYTDSTRNDAEGQQKSASSQRESAYRMTFIDTPGHEAFTKMRQRGVKFADIAVLVVAADDGVKPQTKEAIEILQKEKTPFVVAINKIDKNNADPERAKQDLLRHSVLLEKYGGDVSWVEISAKEGTGIDELLDHLLLMWELEKPVYDPSAPAQGFVLESERDSRKGVVVSVVITNGTLRTGDAVATASAGGKVRMLENFLGERVQELQPSSPAVILGFDALPQAGEEFTVGAQITALETEVLPKPEIRPEQVPAAAVKEEDVVKLILKADVSGSAEALEQIIANTPIEEKTIRILSSEVGDITDNDIKNAETFGAYVIGFNVKLAKSAETYARAKNVTLILSNIIYKLVEELQGKATHQGEDVVLGKLEVLATFSQKNRKQVVGGKVIEGYFTLNERFTIMRADPESGALQPAGKGKILNLQKGKNDVKKVEAGEECGMFVESDVPVEKGDMVIVEQK